MMFCRKKIKELEAQIAFLKETVDYYKHDRDFYMKETERLRIAERLLTDDQLGEYYKLVDEHEAKEAAV